MSTSPILLILGAGSNVGQSVAKEFASKGYRVALAARRLKEEDSTSQELHIPADLSNPSSVAEIFSKVKEKLGVPSVVVYNGRMSLTMDRPPNPSRANLSKHPPRLGMIPRIPSRAHFRNFHETWRSTQLASMLQRRRLSFVSRVSLSPHLKLSSTQETY